MLKVLPDKNDFSYLAWPLYIGIVDIETFSRLGSFMSIKVLVVDPSERPDLIRGLASEVRVSILKLLRTGPRNVNQIAEMLELPQSTVSSNLQILEDAGLITTESQKARKGSQKICRSAFTEILVAFREEIPGPASDDSVNVAMPLGLYTHFEVTGPCGLCSKDGIIGLLDVPDTFLDPDRMKTGLLWFTRGFVEYQFPNNTKLSKRKAKAIEFSMELSSEVPGTANDWPSDIFLEVNGVEVGHWTSPGDFGDKRGVHTPAWWKLAGSQYGKLKNWRINGDGSFVDGVKISDITLDDIEIDAHRSIRMRIGVHEDAEHPGGVNIFGHGFGNYDQDIVLRILS
jgi:predicted transcriptional regulator